MSSQDLQAVVGAWQSGAISRDTMFELFRSGEILPDGRTNEDEQELIRTLILTEGNKGNKAETTDERGQVSAGVLPTIISAGVGFAGPFGKAISTVALQ